MRRVAIALVHHPVLGRSGEVLTTTLTSIDLHDIARSATTYGVEAFYVVHPLASMRMLAKRITHHWTDGGGGKRIPPRAVALGVLRVVAQLDEARADFGDDVELWTTAAEAHGEVTRYADARGQLEGDGPPVMIAFGTGWGLAPELLASASLRLEPIAAARDAGYNHLSVRAAASITLDRLLG